MKNSFAQAYDRKVASDGSISITFKSQRAGALQGAPVVLFMLFVLLPVSFTITYPFLGRSITSGEFQFVPTIIWAAASGLLANRILALLIKTKTSIVIVPKQGIMFNGKSLPFSDINSVGTLTERSIHSKPTAYVYANSRGNRIRIGGHTKPPVAEAIADEIRNASGVPWE